MEIKALTIADLKTALATEDFWLTNILPLSKHRALSFIRNPRAEEDDPVLWVAYQGAQVIGYLGVLPDKIFVNDIAHKLGWLTGWWVDPACAARGIGAVLLFKALNAYDQQIGVSGGSRQARSVLEASQRFFDLKPLPGLDIRLRWNVARDPCDRLARMRIVKVGCKILDAVLDELADRRGSSWQRRNRAWQPLAYEYIASIDEETDRFIQGHRQQDLTRRGKSELDWIMQNPWIVAAPLKDSASRRYYFSSRADRFSYLGVKVFARSAEMIGFLLLKLRDERMSVIYSFFERQHAAVISAAAVHQAHAMGASCLRLDDRQLAASFLTLRFPCRSAEKKSRGFSLSRVFADLPLADCRLQGGDGDLAFY